MLRAGRGSLLSVSSSCRSRAGRGGLRSIRLRWPIAGQRSQYLRGVVTIEAVERGRRRIATAAAHRPKGHLPYQTASAAGTVGLARQSR